MGQRQQRVARGGEFEPERARRSCGIARTMWRAEAAWRSELAATTIADLVAEILETVSPEQVARSTDWFQTVQIRRRRDS